MDDIVSSGIITTDFCKDSSKNTYALQNLRSTAGTVKLTAQWKPVNYNVSVNYNGGSHNVSNDNASALLLSQTLIMWQHTIKKCHFPSRRGKAIHLPAGK